MNSRFFFIFALVSFMTPFAATADENSHSAAASIACKDWAKNQGKDNLFVQSTSNSVQGGSVVKTSGGLGQH